MLFIVFRSGMLCYLLSSGQVCCVVYCLQVRYVVLFIVFRSGMLCCLLYSGQVCCVVYCLQVRYVVLFIVFRSGKHPLHVKAMSRMKERAKDQDVVSVPCVWVGGDTA